MNNIFITFYLKYVFKNYNILESEHSHLKEKYQELEYALEEMGAKLAK